MIAFGAREYSHWVRPPRTGVSPVPTSAVGATISVDGTLLPIRRVKSRPLVRLADIASCIADFAKVPKGDVRALSAWILADIARIGTGFDVVRRH